MDNEGSTIILQKPGTTPLRLVEKVALSRPEILEAFWRRGDSLMLRRQPGSVLSRLWRSAALSSSRRPRSGAASGRSTKLHPAEAASVGFISYLLGRQKGDGPLMENDEVYMLNSQDLQAFSVEGSAVKLRTCSP